MATVTIHRGDVRRAQKSQELRTQTSSRVISADQGTKRPTHERHAHEVWKQRIEEDWQNHIETLQRYVCALARNNLKPRMASTTANEPNRRYGNAVNV
jgi:hypothetical protein